MAWYETPEAADLRMVRQMSGLTAQFESHYGRKVVAAILVTAFEEGRIPSDANDLGKLFEGVTRVSDGVADSGAAAPAPADNVVPLRRTRHTWMNSGEGVTRAASDTTGFGQQDGQLVTTRQMG